MEIKSVFYHIIEDKQGENGEFSVICKIPIGITWDGLKAAIANFGIAATAWENKVKEDLEVKQAELAAQSEQASPEDTPIS